jgi:hypothetical protein
MRSGILYRQAPLALPTGGIASGSSHIRPETNWPTPAVQDAHGRDRHNQKNGGVILSLLGQARQWPTPSVGDATGSRIVPPGTTATGQRPDGRKAQIGLNTAVRMDQERLWPTPRANSGNGAKQAPGAQGGVNLQTAVAMVETWPTPTSTLGSNGGRVTPTKGREGGTLIEALSARTAFATPTARDWRSGKASEATHSRNARPLSEQVGGHLNPGFVEWMMQFPKDWTVVD